MIFLDWQNTLFSLSFLPFTFFLCLNKIKTDFFERIFERILKEGSYLMKER